MLVTGGALGDWGRGTPDQRSACTKHYQTWLQNVSMQGAGGIVGMGVHLMKGHLAKIVPNLATRCL